IEAKKIYSEECLKYGIANKVVNSEDLEKETLDWAIKISKRSPQSLINTKKLMRDSITKTYWETYSQEGDIQNGLTGSKENIEAVKAFFEKREPNFD
ncbi:MAG: enoyl-CoA hydratase/isomerase family protein, partial [Gammaproteobacteria bacterium]